MTLVADFQKHGCALVRGLIAPSVASELDSRLRANLARLETVFPNIETDANRNVFPVSLAVADQFDESLQARLAAAQKSNILDPAFVTDEEKVRFVQAMQPVRNVLQQIGPFELCGLDNCYARFEKARENSDFKTGAIHQDAVFGFRGITVWIALSPCGVEAPALKFVKRKYRELLAQEPNSFMTRSAFRFWRWECPEFAPGDAVIFNSYVVHGTNITPSMTASRTSLDVRFSKQS